MQAMVCTVATIPTSTVGTAAKEHEGLCRSESAKNLCKGAGMQRSYSDNNLCYSVNRIRAASTAPKLKSSRSVGFFPFQLSSSIIPNTLRLLSFDQETSKDMSLEEKNVSVVMDLEESSEEERRIKRVNWVDRLLQIRKEWVYRQQQESTDDGAVCGEDEKGDCDCDCDCDAGMDVCEASCGSEDEEGEFRYDQKSFSRLLKQVPLSDTNLFSELAFLCNMAYVIPEIKEQDLEKYYGLQFVRSSLEKKAELTVIKEKLDQDSTRVPVTSLTAVEYSSENVAEPEPKRPTRPSVASKIAASAASYVHSGAKDLLSLGSESLKDDGINSCKIQDQPQEDGENSPRMYKSEVAACVAASTMTAVVAAGEKDKEEAAKDLQSLHSSPCEWFVCDDSRTYTRCFVIQGSDSLASWRANLLFEPTKFEGTDVLVHRGIYEAAKGIYEQFIPQIMDHLNRHGNRAKFQFTGHSLGGSLSLLVNLMLLTREVVKPSALRPVVTFGSPFVFCGGQKILNHLGLDESHVHCVMMHRDIVPRAFSCNYPNHVALVLKRLNGSLRSHPCLNKNKLLYSPMGKLFILQPDEKSSPPHPLIPPGNALYALDINQCGYSSNALKSFLNSPHPLETLSDPTAYGSDGKILRDHDSSNYLKALNGVLRQHTRTVFRNARKQRNLLWPLLTSPSPHSWSNENNLQSSRIVTKEVITGV